MDKKDIKTLEGTFPVNGDTTPISHEKIRKVDSTTWDTISTAELHDQFETLQQRYYLALDAGINQSALIQLLIGINTIKAELEKRQQTAEITLL